MTKFLALVNLRKSSMKIEEDCIPTDTDRSFCITVAIDAAVPFFISVYKHVLEVPTDDLALQRYVCY